MRCYFLGMLALNLFSLVGLADTGASRAQAILQNRCASCHSGESRLTQYFGDFLDYTNLRQSYVVPGDLKKSFLVNRIDRREMPPRDPLSNDEINTIKEWVKSGAESW